MGQDSPARVNRAEADDRLTLEEILTAVENRYEGSGFSARFAQESTLKAMQITDYASGKLLIKHPGMMRWEYEKPDRQLIITDGKNLWVYRPEDNQVMIGEAPIYFGEGKGAGFLSDIKIIRRQFNIFLEKQAPDGYYVLKLLPQKETFDLSAIYLSISEKNFNVARIVTLNSYGDETRIDLSDFQFKQNPDEAMFTLDVPEGADVLELDE